MHFQSDKALRIAILVNPRRLHRWHGWLADALAGEARDVFFCGGDSKGRRARSIGLALALDRLVHRNRESEGALDPVSIAETVAPADGGFADIEDLFETPPDIIIDCSGEQRTSLPAGRVLTPLFDGLPNEDRVLTALAAGRNVSVAIAGGAGGPAQAAYPAVEYRLRLTEGANNVFSRTVELIAEAVAELGASEAAPATAATVIPFAEADDEAHSSAPLFEHLAKVIGGKLKRKLTGSRPNERWALALRHCEGPGLVNDTWPSAACFTVVPDDGQRFYADPFLFRHEGRTWLFCEEFPFDTERGVISVAEIHADGSLGDFVRVLERPYHLSYPFIMREAGDIWMIPEASESGAVELYRATEFPFRWQLERRLLEDVGGCDATLVRSHDRYVMLLTTPHMLSTTWDNLRIYEAPALTGPWTAHPAGLVTIDSRQARSAGMPFERNGELMRTSQDCSRIYGGGIILNRIDEISEDRFEQTAVARIDVVSPARITGVHTYNRAGDIEAIDIWGNVDGVGQVTVVCRPIDADNAAGTGDRTAGDGDEATPNRHFRIAKA